MPCLGRLSDQLKQKRERGKGPDKVIKVLMGSKLLCVLKSGGELFLRN